MFVSKNMPEKINIDEMRLMQVIYNLVGNASKFTNSGSIGIIFSWINENNITQDMILPSNEDAFRSHLSEKSKNYKSKLIKNKLGIYKSNYMLEYLEYSKQELFTGFPRPQSTFPVSFEQYFMQKLPKTLSYKKLFDNYNILNFEQIQLPDKKPSEEMFEPIITSQNKQGYIKIEIIDSGFGIEPEYTEKIFEKFNQVGNEIHKRLGIGLGLWIAKNICQKMKGDIKCYSNINKGSIFIALVKCDIV